MGEISDELKLKRYLYFLTEKQNSVIKKKGDFCPDLKIESLKNLIVEEKLKNIMDMIEAANNDESLPNRQILFFILVFCIHADDNKVLKTIAYDMASKIIKNTEEFFLFIKYTHNIQKNFSYGVRRVARNFYLKTDASKLYDIIVNQNSYHGWTHRDILRCSHLKSENLFQSILLTYASKGLETAKEKIADNKDVTPEVEELIKKLENVVKFRHCQDEKQIVTMIKEQKYTVKQLPSHFLKSQIVSIFFILLTLNFSCILHLQPVNLSKITKWNT